MGATKAGNVLREAGRIALFWNIGEHDPETQTALDDAYARLAPDVNDVASRPGDWVRDSAGQAHAAVIGSSDQFETPEHRTYEWEQRYTTAEWLDHLPTHSNHRVLPPEELEPLLAAVGRVIDERGGAITLQFRTWMVTARAR